MYLFRGEFGFLSFHISFNDFVFIFPNGKYKPMHGRTSNFELTDKVVTPALQNLEFKKSLSILSFKDVFSGNLLFEYNFKS